MHASALMPPAQMCDEGGATMPQLLYFRPHSSFDMKGTAAYFSTSDTWDTPFRYWVSVKPLSICVCVRLSQMTRQNGVRESATFFVSTVDQESQHAPTSGVQHRLSQLRGRERTQLHRRRVQDLARERDEADVVFEKGTVIKVGESIFVGIHVTRAKLVLICDPKGGAWQISEHKAWVRESGHASEGV